MLAMLERRLRKMCEGEGLEGDAALKSLRAYRTSVHPLLLERLSVHYPCMAYGKVVRGKTFSYHATDRKRGNTLMHYLLQSFYDQEIVDDSEATIIYPKMSVKTITDVEGVDMSIQEQTSLWLESLARDGIVGLRSLAQDDLGPELIENLLEDYENSRFANDVTGFLLSNDLTFPASSYVSVHGRRAHRDLVMSVKYYPARDDKRAYCRDTNKLRCLVGACLNRLIVPKSKVIKSRLHTASIIHPFDKDILRLNVSRPYRHNKVSKLLLCDISNFTGSLGNSWLMLHCMALDTQRELRNKYQLFAIGDTIMVGSWHEILALYCYLTVGYPCHVPELDIDTCLPGGFLGVNANITSGLLCLSFILEDIRDRLRLELDEVHCQAGGDDVAFVMTGTTECVEKASFIVRQELEHYVGALKEFRVIDLEDLEPGKLNDDILFCRKGVICHRARDKFHLIGEESLPLPGSIMPGASLLRTTEIVQAWRELDLALSGYEERHPSEYRVCDSVRALFLMKYPVVQPLRRVGDLMWPPPVECVEHNGRYFTREAYTTVQQIEALRVGYIVGLQTLESKLRHALHKQLVLIKKTTYRGLLVEAVLHKCEESLFKPTSAIERISLNPDTNILDRLNLILDY